MNEREDRARTNGGGALFDDFTVLPGVGSAIDRRLHEAGVCFYRDLHDLDAQRLADLLGGIPSLSPERISNADWVGRAAALATGPDADDVPVAGAEPERPGTDDTAGSGYESFVLRVANRAGQLPRVHVQQVRTGEERHLDGLRSLIVELVGGVDSVDVGPHRGRRCSRTGA